MNPTDRYDEGSPAGPGSQGSQDSQAREEPLETRVLGAIDLLEAISSNRGVLAYVEPALRKRLLIAAGRVSRPGRNAMRAQARVARKVARRKRFDDDQAVLDRTGIRMTRAANVFPTPLPADHQGQISANRKQLAASDVLAAPATPDAPVAPATPRGSVPDEPRRVREPRSCYQCKCDFHDLHFFYDALCPTCAELNWRKRNQTVDLSGRVALLTGGRVKIGYQAGIKLLRAGARLIVTTRFPRDAALRYAAEPDFASWSERLEIHALDLRHTPSVEAFARMLDRRLPRLDFILNNACQTVRRPPGFYAHLVAAEQEPLGELAAVVPQDAMAIANVGTLRRSFLPERPGAPAAALSQIPLLPGDGDSGGPIFPHGQLDADRQQLDLRRHNSWRLTLAEVSTIELLEVHLVNAVAPFVLCARLKPLLLRQPGHDRHIVNVSAMEGQFYRSFKTDRHPHTNMAKAALNMLTRTSAADYVKDGIHMNSVDTGWITDEDPAEIAARKQAERGFHPPLDIVDGAARICDPIFDGLATGDHAWGKFFKDYRETRW